MSLSPGGKGVYAVYSDVYDEIDHRPVLRTVRIHVVSEHACSNDPCNNRVTVRA